MGEKKLEAVAFFLAAARMQQADNPDGVVQFNTVNGAERGEKHIKLRG
jgi:hypothetical protein